MVEETNVADALIEIPKKYLDRSKYFDREGDEQQLNQDVEEYSQTVLGLIRHCDRDEIITKVKLCIDHNFAEYRSATWESIRPISREEYDRIIAEARDLAIKTQWQSEVNNGKTELGFAQWQEACRDRISFNPSQYIHERYGIHQKELWPQIRQLMDYTEDQAYLFVGATFSTGWQDYDMKDGGTRIDHCFEKVFSHGLLCRIKEFLSGK